MRCCEIKVTSSLITDSVKASHASQPMMVISLTKIMPSTGVDKARRMAFQVSSARERIAAENGQGNGDAGGSEQQDGE